MLWVVYGTLWLFVIFRAPHCPGRILVHLAIIYPANRLVHRYDRIRLCRCALCHGGRFLCLVRHYVTDMYDCKMT
jgi:hypothetical protein